MTLNQIIAFAKENDVSFDSEVNIKYPSDGHGYETAPVLTISVVASESKMAECLQLTATCP